VTFVGIDLGANSCGLQNDFLLERSCKWVIHAAHGHPVNHQLLNMSCAACALHAALAGTACLMLPCVHADRSMPFVFTQQKPGLPSHERQSADGAVVSRIHDAFLRIASAGCLRTACTELGGLRGLSAKLTTRGNPSADVESVNEKLHGAHSQ